ncbi:MAG: ABC transporter permease [Cyclobacteriaceae bacterium]|nr:ABC transporter permease [Cyclobacteriaceae bacterium]
MFRNYFKIGIRNILKYKVFSMINIFGLAMSMSVCMLIILMLADQKSYDQFHNKKDHTYRILSKIKQSAVPNASSPFPLAKTMKEDYPIIEEATHLVPGVGGDATYGQQTAEMRGYFADASFFEVFSFDLLKGNPAHALTSPNSMVITNEIARLLFRDEDPIGKRVEFANRGLGLNRVDFGSETSSSPVDWGSYTITGVLDSKKFKSHLKFDVLVSADSRYALYQEEKITDLTDNWKWYSYCYTYVVLAGGQTEQGLIASLNDLVTRKYAEFESLEGIRLIPQNLNRITPGMFVGNPSSLLLPVEAYYFLAFFALVVLVLACVNYTNLSIARALTRAKEIGIRKVSGANKKSLVFQFLSESVMTALFALALANILLLLVKPAFMGLWVNRYLNFDLNESMPVYIAFIGLALFIGLLAGFYPALHLSRYSPVKVLYALHRIMPGKLGMRKFLNISQFAVSLFFIITSILIYHQFRHYLEFDYGFDSENIVNVPIQGNSYQLMANEFRMIPGVSTVSASEYIPATAMANGIGVRKTAEDEVLHFEHMSIDADFVENLGLSLVAGRNLPAEGKPNQYVLVNETAVKRLGYASPDEIIGETLEAMGYPEEVEVVGVLKDFRFQTPVMEDKTGPLMFRNDPESFSYLNLKITSNDLPGTLAKLEDTWKSLDPVHPFRYQFFDDQLVKVNQWLGDLVSVIGFIAFIAVTIACLGMLGMATYTAERKTKEVGIRKVLGADTFHIVLLLSKGFLKTLIISVLIGAPVSYLINNLWLQNFPNRVSFGVGTVLLGTLIILALGMITVCSQTLRIAYRNPVDSLRSE